MTLCKWLCSSAGYFCVCVIWTGSALLLLSLSLLSIKAGKCVQGMFKWCEVIYTRSHLSPSFYFSCKYGAETLNRKRTGCLLFSFSLRIYSLFLFKKSATFKPAETTFLPACIWLFDFFSLHLFFFFFFFVLGPYYIGPTSGIVHELLVTFNLYQYRAVMQCLLLECDDRMTLPTFAWTLSGVDLVRHRDQSDPP